MVGRQLVPVERRQIGLGDGETFTLTEALLFTLVNGKVAEIQDLFADISLNAGSAPAGIRRVAHHTWAERSSVRRQRPQRQPSRKPVGVPGSPRSRVVDIGCRCQS